MYFISLQSFFPHWLIQILFYRKWHQSCWVIRIYIYFFTPPSIYFQLSGHGSTLKTVLKYTITFIIHINVVIYYWWSRKKFNLRVFAYYGYFMESDRTADQSTKIKMDHHVQCFIWFFLSVHYLGIYQ